MKVKAKTIRKVFSRETSVTTVIDASPSMVWQVLLNASDYSSWTKTILSIEGNIELGNAIKLRSYLDPKRVFKLTIKKLDPLQKMVWGDENGDRIFQLTLGNNGMTIFQMSEKMGGIMFPLYAFLIPSFDESFEQFATDLMKKAEIITKQKKI